MSEGAFTMMLIWFCLAVLGASTALSDRSKRRFRAHMNWKARAGFYRKMGLSEGMVQQLKAKFYAQQGMKTPK